VIAEEGAGVAVLAKEVDRPMEGEGEVAFMTAVEALGAEDSTGVAAGGEEGFRPEKQEGQ